MVEHVIKKIRHNFASFSISTFCFSVFAFPLPMPPRYHHCCPPFQWPASILFVVHTNYMAINAIRNVHRMEINEQMTEIMTAIIQSTKISREMGYKNVQWTFCEYIQSNRIRKSKSNSSNADEEKTNAHH